MPLTIEHAGETWRLYRLNRGGGAYANGCGVLLWVGLWLADDPAAPGR